MKNNRTGNYRYFGERERQAHIGLITGLVLCCATPAFASEDLGIIQVDSTTIDDKFEQKRDEPSNIGIVSGETVDNAHTENIQQLLQSIPGITTEVQSGEALKIHIRGIENQTYMGERPGVAIVIDGVPVFERTGQVNIDLNNIESIKVIKGGASYLFGDDALGGAVIITTKRGAGQSGVKIAAEVGSFGHKKKVARAGYAGDNWNGHIQLSKRETDGYYDNSESESKYVNGKLQYYIDDASDLIFGFEQAERLKNSHGAVRGVTQAKIDPKSEDPSNSDYASNFDVKLDKYFLTYSRDIGETANLMMNTYQYTDETLFNQNPVDTSPSDYGVETDYKQVQRGLKVEYRSGSERLAWMAATDLRDNTYESIDTFLDCTDYSYMGPGCVVGSTYKEHMTEEKVKAVYGELKFQVSDPLVVTANGRYDRIDLDYTDIKTPADSGKNSFDLISWRLGMNYAMQDNLDLYGNLSTGFRTPTVTQLFTGQSFPTHRAAANPNLTEEESLNFELGLRSETEWFGVPIDIDLSIFQIDRKDFIQSSAGLYTTSPDAMYQNVGDARNRGLELALKTDSQREFSWELAYTHLSAKYTKYDNFYQHVEPVAASCAAGYTYVPAVFFPNYIPADCYKVSDIKGNELARTPNHVINLIARYRPAPNWVITGEMSTKSSFYADEINQEEISGHTVFNLLVNYDREIGNSKWSLFARVDNLFDKTYYNTARSSSSDSDDDGDYDAEDLSLVVNQGRTLTAGVSISF